MTTIIDMTTKAGEEAVPPAPVALHAMTHVVQRVRRTPGHWTLTAWAHKSWSVRQVHGIECVPGEDEELWVADTLAGLTTCPVQQFLVMTNLAPGITLGYSFEANGRVFEVGLMFTQHVELIELNGPDLMDTFVANARALWGPAWDPQPTLIVMGEEGEE